MKSFASFAAGEADAGAGHCAADLRVSRAQVAMFIMRQRLIRALSVSLQGMRNAMRQAAQLREQQGENQQ